MDRKAARANIELFRKYGKYSGFFKKAEEYKERTKYKQKPMTKEEQAAYDTEDRYCFHWGCEKVYKNLENQDRLPCRFHPGRWDFGHSGLSITQAMEDKTCVLWEPHWTCCRGKWKTPGCKRGVHKGPRLKVYEKNEKKYKWPDLRAQIYFKKSISEHWKEFLSKHTYEDIRSLEAIFNYFASSKGTNGVR